MSNKRKNEKNRKSFWTTLPGILTSIAAIITAIGGILAIVYVRVLIHQKTSKKIRM